MCALLMQAKNLRSQTLTSSWGGQRYLPFVFTEHGVLQLANILRSQRARKMSIRIIEVFVKMREILNSHKEILRKLEEIERKYADHDDKIMLIFEYIKRFEETKKQHIEQANRRRIGFNKSDEE